MFCVLYKFYHLIWCLTKLHLLTAAGHASAGCCSVWVSAGEPGVSSAAAGCPACCRSGPGTAGRSGWWTAGWGWSRCCCDSDSAPACSCCSPGPLGSLTADCSSGPKRRWRRMCSEKYDLYFCRKYCILQPTVLFGTNKFPKVLREREMHVNTHFLPVDQKYRKENMLLEYMWVDC